MAAKARHGAKTNVLLVVRAVVEEVDKSTVLSFTFSSSIHDWIMIFDKVILGSRRGNDNAKKLSTFIYL